MNDTSNGENMIAEGSPSFEGVPLKDEDGNVMGRVVSVETFLPLGSSAKGTATHRNLPKPDARKKRRRQQRESRRGNR